jgi:organic hydroperoxide reductase OsmC/OhrA
MGKLHQYNLKLQWTGNSGLGTSNYTSYERSHIIKIDGKADIVASSDPSFRGDPKSHNPEELFLASISSCHMLWYLHLCSAAGIVVSAYEDNPEGVMEETEIGGGRFIAVTLKPKVTITDVSLKDLAMKLHHQANENCFIANSLNFKVQHSVTILN